MNFKEFILLENKQEIVALGFPRIIADIIFKYFGKNAFQVAKWNKDYSYQTKEPNWWYITNNSYSSKSISLGDYVRLYESCSNLDDYKKAYMDVYGREAEIEEQELLEQKESLENRIEADLMELTFFSNYNLIVDIKNETLTDIAPYKKLSFEEAQNRYDKKNIFKDREPIKIYSNGWKWINVGKKCHLMGKMMKNCGSAGVMSLDADKTIIALFDKSNKPHVMVTYSPNEKRISGEEGAGSTAVKDKYANYVMDLARDLNSFVDTYRGKNKIIKIKYNFGIDADVETIENKYGGQLFSIKSKGKQYYADSNYAVEQSDIEKIIDYKKKTGKYPFSYHTMGNIIKLIFNFGNKQEIERAGIGVNYIKLKDETGEY